jgi:hypothetical protein
MKRADKKRLDSFDLNLLAYVLHLQNMLSERATMDPEGTIIFAEKVCETLQASARMNKPPKQ